MTIDKRDEIASNAIPESQEHRLFRLRRRTAIIAMLAGAIGSVALTLHAGRHNPSRLLQLLFTLWVLSPFVVLAIANAVSSRWSGLTGTTLYIVTLILTACSLAIYAYVALGPPRTKIASFFLIVPPASWLLTAIAILTSARMSRKIRTE